jgi:radical SAM superfamily enzyme YgiQ (UPF0313 family)
MTGGSSSGHPYPFLPTTRADLDARGWDAVDIVIVSGDAYVDHPAFGPVLIARFLEGRGFRVGLIPQPDWQSAEAFKALGKPRLFFGVAAGNLDSMLNRLTSQKKNRERRSIQPRRPHRRAPRSRHHRLREPLPRGVPRRADRARRHRGLAAPHRALRLLERHACAGPILLDAKADLLVFGMGERPVWEIARRLRDGESIKRAARHPRHRVPDLRRRDEDARG